MKKLILMAALAPALLAGCSDQNYFPNFSENSSQHGLVDPELANVITVTDFEDKALAGAQVLIGDANNVPFSGNFLTTDENGQVEIPAAWDSAQSLTVGAKNYVRVTYIAQAPGPITIKLNKMASSTQYEVRGAVTGLPVADFDKQVDYGIVMPALTKLNSLVFDINQFISPINDQVSTLGQTMDIPSNISVPAQKERYSILTATLNKPLYRIYFDMPGVTRLYTLRGRFEFSPVVDALRKGKSFVEVLNMFNITGSGTRDLNISSSSTTKDIPGNEVTFAAKKKATAPTSVKDDETFIAVSANMQSGYIVPTDLKSLARGQSMDLSVHNKGSSYLLGVLKKTADLGVNSGPNPISTTLIPFGSSNTTPQLLPLIAAPKLSNTGDLILPAPSVVRGIAPLATYSVLSQMREVTQGTSKVVVPKRLWEVYASDWVDKVKLPEWPGEGSISGKKRWETSFFGGPQSASQDKLGPAIIEAATHATHSELTF